jgi:hypothetical protein
VLKLLKTTLAATPLLPPRLILPPHPIVHLLRLLLHPLHPALRQVVILLLQLLLLLFRHVELQRQSDHLVLNVLHKLALALELIIPVFAAPLQVDPYFLELCDALSL